MSQKFETGADLKLAEVVVRAERAEAEVERLLPRAKLMTAVADKLPLCPDHRGKQHGTECLVCEVERLRALPCPKCSGMQPVETIYSLRAKLHDEQAECERLLARLAWFENAGGVTVTTKNYQTVAERDEARAEVERLRIGLGAIMSCAGAPDPAGALHTVIELARRALGDEAQKTTERAPPRMMLANPTNPPTLGSTCHRVDHVENHGCGLYGCVPAAAGRGEGR
jgi:hypothetical protein